MSNFEEHCQESIIFFRKPYTEVHRWLDAFAFHPGFIGMQHRRERHHLEGLKQVERIFGAEAIAPAQRHIISDLKMLGFKEGVDPFPKNKDEFIRLEALLLRRCKSQGHIFYE